MEEIIKRLDKIFSIGGGLGTSSVYVYENGIIIGDVTIFLNQCVMAFILAIIGGIGGWLGGFMVKKLYNYLLKKKWFRKLFKLKLKDSEKIN